MTLKKGLFLGLLLMIVIIGLTAFAIIFEGMSDNIKNSDVAIILGSKVKSNGLPSARLAARLNKGIQLYQQRFFQHIIVSGGIGKEGYDEATVMKQYLVARGIPSSAILVDHNGYNTQRTAINSKAIMEKNHFRSALVITQYFHVLRAKLALKKAGISPVYHAHAAFFEWRDFYSLAREVLGFYDYLFFRDFHQASLDK